METRPRQIHGLRVSPSDDPELFTRVATVDAGPIRFYFYADVLDELEFASTVETGPALAVLTGGFGLAQPFVEISGFAGLSSTEMENAYDSARSTVESCIKSGSIVTGLYVREPNLSAVPSTEAARLHLSLFNVPAQPLLAHDPNNDMIAAYMRNGATFVNVPISVVTAMLQDNESSIVANANNEESEE